MAEKCKQQAKMHQKKKLCQIQYKFFFEQFWKVEQKTKLVHFFNNSKLIFLKTNFSEALLKIKFKFSALLWFLLISTFFLKMKMLTYEKEINIWGISKRGTHMIDNIMREP